MLPEPAILFMDIREALHILGATHSVLSSDEEQSLDELGYVRLAAILTDRELDLLWQRQAELLASEGEVAGSETHQEAGTACLSDLINKGDMFHVVLTHPRVLAAVARVLEFDLKLSSLNSRTALPGSGHQGLHPDWEGAVPPGEYQVCNSLWLLDNFTSDNGATRIVSGSHRSGRVPADEMPDTGARHPDETLLMGNAGDVIVFNGHLWHGGTANRSRLRRRAMHGYFCRRHHEPQLDQQRFLRPETWHRLSTAARVVLGVTAENGDEKPGTGLFLERAQ